MEEDARRRGSGLLPGGPQIGVPLDGFRQATHSSFLVAAEACARGYYSTEAEVVPVNAEFSLCAWSGLRRANNSGAEVGERVPADRTPGPDQNGIRAHVCGRGAKFAVESVSGSAAKPSSTGSVRHLSPAR
ncbi:hypothetical protein GCM10027403_07590 [Arthrobacter tecti]